MNENICLSTLKYIQTLIHDRFCPHDYDGILVGQDRHTWEVCDFIEKFIEKHKDEL